MVTASLRKVGGSVMVAIPPAILDLVEMRADMEVSLSVEEDRIIVQPVKKRRYSLAELVAQCDLAQSPADREWVDAPAVGGELL